MKVFVVVALTLLVAVQAADPAPAAAAVNPDKKCDKLADPKVATSKNEPADCNPKWPEGCKDTCPATLKFIDDGTPAKSLPELNKFTPVVMNQQDSRDVLRKIVKEKDTAFVIQFFKGFPDRDLRDDLYRYVLLPKTSPNYKFQSKYEYAEVNVDDAKYKDLIDNLSFKQKFDSHDFPYDLYSYKGKGYMVHGPGIAREVFDLRKEVEAGAKKESAPAPAPAAATNTPPKL